MKITFFYNSDHEVDLDRLKELIPFDIEFNVIESNFKPPFVFNYTKNGKQYYSITDEWLSKHVHTGDLVVFSYSDSQWGGKASGGRFHGLINGIPTITMTSTDGQKREVAPDQYESEFVGRFIHEMSHAMYRHMLKQKDVTHEKDYNEKNLLGVMDDWKDYTIKKRLVVLLKKLLELLRKKTIAPTVQDWGMAVKEFEGWYEGSRAWRNRNPGNLRFSPFQARNEDGYAVFDTYEDGWNALLHQLRISVNGKSAFYHPEMTLLEWAQVYAPSGDNNHPQTYARFVAKKLGVGIDYKIGNIHEVN